MNEARIQGKNKKRNESIITVESWKMCLRGEVGQNEGSRLIRRNRSQLTKTICFIAREVLHVLVEKHFIHT